MCSGADGGRYGGGEGGGLQLFVLLHSGALLLLVVIDDVLVGWAGLCEGVKVVHVEHVSPQVLQLLRDLKVGKIFPSHSDVLQLGHELTVKAAHCVPGEEPCPSLSKVIIDFAEVVQQDVLRVVIALKKHKLEFTVHIFCPLCDVLILNKEVVATRDVLHDVSLNLVVLQNCQAIVNQDGRRSGLKI